MITGQDIEEAEAALVRSRSIVPATTVLYDRARVLPEACDNFIKHNSEQMHRRLPNLDPRIDPTFNTMIRHAFLVGAIAGREDQRKNGDAT